MEAKLSDKPLFIPPSLEEASWQQIKEISDAGLASSVFKVGDMKKIVLNGTVGTVQFNNYETYIYIIGIDHNKEIEGTGITFGCFKNKDGVDIALVDSKYNTNVLNEEIYFVMNSRGRNDGGWQRCTMRYSILGSTDTANRDATATTATNPVANTLMAALPSDLRAVMKPMTIYTNNNGIGNNASYVDETIDYLPLLGEYEIFGTRSYANSAEQNYQAQYAYYSTGNSKVKYKHNATSSAVKYLVRSPYYKYETQFCIVNEDGEDYVSVTNYSRGIAPIFRV